MKEKFDEKNTTFEEFVAQMSEEALNSRTFIIATDNGKNTTIGVNSTATEALYLISTIIKDLMEEAPSQAEVEALALRAKVAIEIAYSYVTRDEAVMQSLIDALESAKDTTKNGGKKTCS